MKSKRKLTLFMALGLLLFSCLAILVLLQTNNQFNFIDTAYAVAEINDEANSKKEKDYIVTFGDTQVNASFIFTKLNDTDCSVRLSNKADATKAIVPSTAMLDGKKYNVTEIPSNGFASAKKLERVKLPANLKKIGNSAFNNCPELSRIIFSKVEEIGNNAFAKCPKLFNINLPDSIIKVGSTIFRDNNTQAFIEGGDVPAGWATLWNAYNNGEYELGRTYNEKKEFEVMSDPLARSANAYLGAVVASGQPEYFNVKVNEEENLFKVPAEIEADDGNIYEVIAIADNAFDEVSVNVIIEYSENPILLSTNAFYGYCGEVVCFNREIKFEEFDSEAVSTEIFSFSSVKAVVLPNSLNCLAENMFYYCDQLSNIYFVELNAQNDISLPDINNLNGIIELGSTGDGITIIDAGAFFGSTGIKELHIYSKVTYVGAEVFGDWQNSQYVYVHSNSNIQENWDGYWHGGFANIEFTETLYIVKLDSKGGKLPNNLTEIKVVNNVPDNMLPIPEKDYCIFKGWKDTYNKIYTDDDLCAIKSNLTLTASWEDETFDVYLDNKNGTGILITGIKYGEKMPTELDGKELVCPMWEGRDFNGYFTGEDGSGDQYYERVYGKDILMSDKYYNDTNVKILYAFWKMKTFDVLLLNEFSNERIKVQATYEDYLSEKDVNDIPLTITPIYGMEFGGYWTERGGEGDCYYGTNERGNKIVARKKVLTLDLPILYAHYTYKTATVTIYDEKLGTEIEVEATYRHAMPSIDKYDNELELPYLTGYEFKGYFSDSNDCYYDDRLIGAIYMDLSVTSLYADWTCIEYIIDYRIKDNNPNKINKFTVEDNNYELLPVYDWEKGRKFVWDIKNLNEVNVEELTNNMLVLDGEWEDIVTKIIYNLNGGTNAVGNKTSIRFSETLILQTPTKVGYAFDGWELNSKKVNTLHNIDEERITLVATWKYRIDNVEFIRLNYSETSLNLSSYADIQNYVIELPKVNFNNTFLITVSSNVNKLHIYSTNGSTYYLSIKIEARSTDFELILENLTMTIPTSYESTPSEDYCINMVPTFQTKLKLYTYGFVSIKGREGANGSMYGNKNGGNAEAAINCNMLEVCYADDLLITGGNGGVAAAGGKGGAGAVAIKLVSAEPTLCDNVKVTGGCNQNVASCCMPWSVTPNKWGPLFL